MLGQARRRCVGNEVRLPVQPFGEQLVKPIALCARDMYDETLGGRLHVPVRSGAGAVLRSVIGAHVDRPGHGIGGPGAITQAVLDIFRQVAQAAVQDSLIDVGGTLFPSAEGHFIPGGHVRQAGIASVACAMVKVHQQVHLAIRVARLGRYPALEQLTTRLLEAVREIIEAFNVPDRQVAMQRQLPLLVRPGRGEFE
ncbi:hypothetical protein D3C79_587790 [compost metagenome]